MGAGTKNSNFVYLPREEQGLIDELDSFAERQKGQEGHFRREREKYNAELNLYQQAREAQLAIIAEWEAERDKITQENQAVCERILGEAEKRYEQECSAQLKKEFPTEPVLINAYLGLSRSYEGGDFYVEVAPTETVRLADFLRLLIRCNPSGAWPTWQIQDDQLRVTIPSIVVVDVKNRSQMGKAEWERAAQILPERHTIIRTTEGPKQTPKVRQTRIVDVDDPLMETDPHFQDYVRRSYEVNGQSQKEINETELWREDQIDTLTKQAQVNSPSVSSLPKTNKPKSERYFGEDDSL
ncbi:hypothetical protein [Armatimonas sp.]|uniref:hypothetical protein n=1 Tax=Armatimonas sp. TaxID=1872638 RepID=UPI0037522568